MSGLSRTADGGAAAGAGPPRTADAASETGVASRISGPDREAPPALSVIIPVTERPEPLGELYREYAGELRSAAGTTEFLFVAPSWRRGAMEPLEALRDEGEPIRLLEVGGEVTEAALLRAAAGRVRAKLVLTLPAYYRVEARALLDLVEPVARDTADLAVARRAPRRDSWINRIQTRAFHGLLHLLAGGTVRDTGCGVWAMRTGVLEDVPLYGDFFRFLPVLAKKEGYRVFEVDAPQHRRDAHPRVYGPGTYVRRLLDLLGLFFLTRFTYKPLRFFGLVGTGLGIAGLGILGVVFVQRVMGEPLADRPLLVLGVLLATLGVQAVALGLVGEIIVHFNAPDRPSYRVLEDAGEEG